MSQREVFCKNCPRSVMTQKLKRIDSTVPIIFNQFRPCFKRLVLLLVMIIDATQAGTRHNANLAKSLLLHCFFNVCASSMFEFLIKPFRTVYKKPT